jgi:hypothetical protein
MFAFVRRLCIAHPRVMIGFVVVAVGGVAYVAILGAGPGSRRATRSASANVASASVAGVYGPARTAVTARRMRRAGSTEGFVAAGPARSFGAVLRTAYRVPVARRVVFTRLARTRGGALRRSVSIGRPRSRSVRVATARTVASHGILNARRMSAVSVKADAALRAVARARKARLATPAARRARLLSRTRYRRLSDRAALALARSRFGSSMFARPFNASAPARGVRRVRGLSAHAEVVSEQPTMAAAVARNAGRKVLLSSTSLTASNGQPANLTVAPPAVGFSRPIRWSRSRSVRTFRVV